MVLFCWLWLSALALSVWQSWLSCSGYQECQPLQIKPDSCKVSSLFIAFTPPCLLSSLCLSDLPRSFWACPYQWLKVLQSKGGVCKSPDQRNNCSVGEERNSGRIRPAWLHCVITEAVAKGLTRKRTRVVRLPFLPFIFYLYKYKAFFFLITESLCI